ncbi:hypothetical protein CWB99_02585 [Pseudoalteromonas rubra]|uniref:DUF3718 domain-containing protein n=1 Tax=Pseudoalteromonas rubra TaxID=43658 RepID=A0A5S3WTB9_9GAMM|nr:DUF3718 domain-containing protein [Pseudoalteromonas rubra]TMP30265.1 hypothetical protein CWC00_17900 [Pseudoalteromonas rubra]TMP31865.1 hypothetical protein CWB99_02585 [Pseudoalteromonas rubra]
MKFAKALILSPLLLATSISANAGGVEFVGTDNSVATQLCIAVGANHRLTLRKELEEHHISRQIVTDKLTCNDLSVSQFTKKFGLHKSAQLLNIDTNTDTSIRDIAMSEQQKTIAVYGSK